MNEDIASSMVENSGVSFAQVVRTGFVWLASAYVVGLMTYLSVRLLFGDGFWQLSLANSFAQWMFLPLPVLFILAFTFRHRRLMAGMLPLVTVGLIWFVPYFAPKGRGEVSGIPLRVLTLNVWGNNHDLTQLEKWIRETGVDVVLLQEISPAYATDHLTNLQDIYPYQTAQPDNSRWGGNLTLSRYPIVSAEFIDLQIPKQPSPERIVLDIQGRAITVYNVHMAWPVGEPRAEEAAQSVYARVLSDFDDRIRNEQLRRFLEHLQSEANPYVVGGDFNTSDFSVTYGQLAAQMQDAFKEAGVGLGSSWPVASARGLPAWLPPLIRIDYLWHSDGLKTLAAWQGPPVGSDHLPLFATFDIMD